MTFCSLIKFLGADSVKARGRCVFYLLMQFDKSTNLMAFEMFRFIIKISSLHAMLTR